MKELDLYKFIEDYNCLAQNDGKKCIIWVYHFCLDEFVVLIGQGVLDNGGIDVNLQDEFVAIDLNYICDYHNIDVNEVVGIE